MASQSVSLTAAGTSTPVPINLNTFRHGVGLIVTLSAGGSAAYDVEVTGDDPSGSAFTRWNEHDILKNKTASANSNLAFPVTAVRLNADSVTGTLTLSVVQVYG